MTDRFANLTKACGGSLTIESLTEFQLAMREYEIFMSGMREMLAPVDDTANLSDDEMGINRPQYEGELT